MLVAATRATTPLPLPGQPRGLPWPPALGPTQSVPEPLPHLACRPSRQTHRTGSPLRRAPRSRPCRHRPPYRRTRRAQTAAGRGVAMGEGLGRAVGERLESGGRKSTGVLDRLCLGTCRTGSAGEAEPRTWPKAREGQSNRCRRPLPSPQPQPRPQPQTLPQRIWLTPAGPCPPLPRHHCHHHRCSCCSSCCCSICCYIL